MRRKSYPLEYRSPWSVELVEEVGKSPLVRLAQTIEKAVLKNALAITLTTSKLSKKRYHFSQAHICHSELSD